MDKKQKALRNLEIALCGVLNGSFDPYEPVDLWRKEVWNAMAELSKASNAAYEAGCFTTPEGE